MSEGIKDSFERLRSWSYWPLGIIWAVLYSYPLWRNLGLFFGSLSSETSPAGWLLLLWGVVQPPLTFLLGIKVITRFSLSMWMLIMLTGFCLSIVFMFDVYFTFRH